MIRRQTTNTPEEDALEQWASSDERAIRKDAIIMRQTEVGRTEMQRILIAAASAEQLKEIKRVAKPHLRS